MINVALCEKNAENLLCTCHYKVKMALRDLKSMYNGVEDMYENHGIREPWVKKAYGEYVTMRSYLIRRECEM